MQKNKHMVMALTASALVLGLISIATTTSATVDGIGHVVGKLDDLL